MSTTKQVSVNGKVHTINAEAAGQYFTCDEIFYVNQSADADPADELESFLCFVEKVGKTKATEHVVLAVDGDDEAGEVDSSVLIKQSVDADGFDIGELTFTDGDGDQRNVADFIASLIDEIGEEEVGEAAWNRAMEYTTSEALAEAADRNAGYAI